MAHNLLVKTLVIVTLFGAKVARIFDKEMASEKLFSLHNYRYRSVNNSEAYDLWKLWVRFNDKWYKTSQEEFKRFEIFKGNLETIKNLNIQNKDAEFALNHFADISHDEMKSKILMPKRKAPVFEKERYIVQNHGHVTLPAEFDWRDHGVVTAVKNQGSAGSCWAFSTVGNLEGIWALAGHTLTNLSVEQIVDCDGTKDAAHHHADCGIFGGWPYLAYQYVIRAGGIESDKSLPYCSGFGGAPGQCFMCQAKGFNKTLCGPPIPWCNQTCSDVLDRSKFIPGLKVSNWKAVDSNETIIAEQLIKLGPLSIALNAELLVFYHSGVFDPWATFCPPDELDHAVLLVGFGKYKGWFHTTDYWLVKNSWGPSWGENGYFRISRGKGTCGVNTAVTTAEL
ncbi:unnamed protein product [Owenia fusiformis]|uniref:Uncharacterized protein n=1 Tax=Owenia fusiformis TaxID=6347 RepID=A0A8J1UIN5_OWEFU|nr:unnamed protein product [Owenia fusiformis]